MESFRSSGKRYPHVRRDNYASSAPTRAICLLNQSLQIQAIESSPLRLHLLAVSASWGFLRHKS
eukprot:scaffold7435_cov74-Skeletonema_menzelii.AAC.12